MSTRRVQVERLRTSTISSPTASPVDTYVRPAQQEVVPTRAQQIVAALAPAVSTISKIEYKKDLDAKAKADAEAERLRRKAEAEAEAEKKRQQVVSARIAFSTASSDWDANVSDNNNRYLGMSIDDVMEERTQFFSERLGTIEDPRVLQVATEENLFEAIKFKSSMQEKQKGYRTEQAFTSGIEMLNKLPANAPPEEFSRMANGFFNDMRGAYKLDPRKINDSLMTYAYQRVKQGDQRLWNYLQSQKQDQVGDASRQQTVAQIRDEIVSQQKTSATAGLKQLNIDLRKDAESLLVESWDTRGAITGALPFEYTDAEGNVKEITKERQEIIYQKALNQRYSQRLEDLQANPEFAEQAPLIVIAEKAQAYARAGLKDDVSATQLEMGMASFTKDLREDSGEAIAQAEGSYALFNFMFDSNEKYVSDLVKGDTFKAYRTVKTLMEDQGDTFEQAFHKVRSGMQGTAPYDSLKAARIGEAVNDQISGGVWGTDTVDSGYIHGWLKRNAEAYVQYNGLSEESALAMASEDFNSSHVKIRNRFIDTSNMIIPSNVPNFKVDAAFELALGNLPEDYSMKRISGQNNMFVIVDEVGNIALDVEGVPLEANTFSTEAVADIFRTAEMMDLKKLADETKALSDYDAELEAEVDAIVAEKPDNLIYKDTWLSRWRIKRSIIRERYMKNIDKTGPNRNPQ